jgi:anaerobic ribonucleoside-triphosphate reductase
VQDAGEPKTATNAKACLKTVITKLTKEHIMEALAANKRETGIKFEVIRKRDGKLVAFDAAKITGAIYKASVATAADDISESDIARITDAVIAELPSGVIPSVEEIQDVVEKKLIAANYAETAKAYILYRAQRAKIREGEDGLMDIYGDLTFSYSKDVDLMRENANIDADSAMGTMLKYGSEGAKYYVDHYVLPKDISKAHIEGDIHIHDKDFYMLTETCCQIDLIKLFKNGFSTGHGFLREPKSITSYAALACIAIQANQNEMHGGQSIPNFDYAMVGGVKKTYRKEYIRSLAMFSSVYADIPVEELKTLFEDENIKADMSDTSPDPKIESILVSKLGINEKDAKRIIDRVGETAYHDTDRTTFQAMKALIHNLNTMNSRAGAQVPFSSINYGTDTSEEGRMVVRNLLLATDAGLGGGETPIFPVQIFKVKEGINYNEGDKNYDLFKLAMEVSAKRLFPNFSFLDAPFNLPFYREGDYNTEVAYMGCRTRVLANVHDPERQVTCGRGNLSFTSINLPRLGIEAKGDIGKFYEMLDEKIELVVRQLLHRFKIQSRKKGKNYPFLMGQGIWIDSDDLTENDSVGEVLKHGTLSIGFIGLAETLKALTGKHHGESEESRKLGLEIITRMRKKTDWFSQEYKLNFTLLATPAEGLSGRFVAIDRKKYGVIEGVTDRDYYTNSFHVPVYYETSAYNKIDIEAPYHSLTNAGHISYVELDGDVTKNIKAFEKIIRLMKEKGMGYGSINHPVDRDPVCGYCGVIGKTCPGCNRTEDDGVKFERIRRITGYLVGTTDRFNNAKQKEERDRVKHGI